MYHEGLTIVSGRCSPTPVLLLRATPTQQSNREQALSEVDTRTDRWHMVYSAEEN